MVHIVLVRHGESHANAAGILAGRLPDVALTRSGAQQIRDLVHVLPWRTVTELRHSTVQRCEETTAVLLEGIEAGIVRPAPEFLEVDYGDWSGRRLDELKRLPEWKRVAHQPSAMAFPGGEALPDAAQRAVRGVADFVADLRLSAGDSGAGPQQAPAAVPHSSRAGSRPPGLPVGVVVAHGDIIKAVLASALGMPLDDFQRIAVAPGSYSSILYPSTGHPTVTAMSVTASGRVGRAGVVGGGA